MNSIAVIGGGAAGMMAAAAFKEVAGDASGAMLFEKNSYLGAKVIISGGGRCNVTAGIFDVRRLLENYPRGAKFLMSAMFRFPPEKVIEWFESRGVKMKVEEGLRVFPVSNNGKDVVGALERELKKTDVKMFFNFHVTKVIKTGSKFVLQAGDEKAGGQKHEADAVILTTGGNAYCHTGSTGDGYAFAKDLGHTITPLAPSLNSFLVSDEWIGKLAGVSIQKGGLRFFGEGGAEGDAGAEGARGAVYERTGPFVFTHRGVSGPAVFALSSLAAYESYSKEKPCVMSINFFPDETHDRLKRRFQNLANGNGKKLAGNFLDIFLPKSLCAVFMEILRLPHDLQTGQLSKEQRNAICRLMQNFQLHVAGRGAGDEFVTAGGVKLDEVNTNTMESKICPGLFFAGEILDVDAFTGGFNLQASWATGRLAGESAASFIGRAVE